MYVYMYLIGHARIDLGHIHREGLPAQWGGGGQNLKWKLEIVLFEIFFPGMSLMLQNVLFTFIEISGFQ